MRSGGCVPRPVSLRLHLQDAHVAHIFNHPSSQHVRSFMNVGAIWSSMSLCSGNTQKTPKPTYPGHPLQQGEIRVVKLRPGEWADPIRCELSNADINIVHYRALSYVWGSQRVTRKIQLDDRIYRVTTNLERALRHLREVYKDGLYFWIDALYVSTSTLLSFRV
jgi:hypothetical protein